MSQKIKVSIEEQLILDKLTIEQLQFNSKLADSKDFEHLKSLINTLQTAEKNYMLGTTSKEPNQITYEVAYCRGGINTLRMMAEIILASSHELQKREQKRKDLQK